MASPSPRAARTRDALLRAGLDLFSARPIDAVSIDQVVAAAGVAKGSFFNHFTDKRQFATIIASGIRAEIESAVEAINADTAAPLDRLAGGMIAAAVFALSNPKRASVLAQTARSMTLREHPLNKGLRDDVENGIAAGDLKPAAAEAGTLFWLGCCQSVMAALVEQRATIDSAVPTVQAMLFLGLSGLAKSEEAAAAASDPARLRDRMARAYRGAGNSDQAPG